MKKQKSVIIFSIIFILSLFTASFALASGSPFTGGDRYIIGGNGGELGKSGFGAYFGIDKNAPGTHDGNTSPIVAPSFAYVFEKGQVPGSYYGGSGGNITFGKLSEDYTFNNNLFLVAGKGGATENTGIGAKGGNALLYAKSLDIKGDFTALTGSGGKGAKGGNIIIQVAGNIVVGGKFTAHGGDVGTGGSTTGNTNIKAAIIATQKGASFVRTQNNMYLTLTQLYLGDNNAVALFQSNTPGGALRAKIDILIIKKSALLNLVGTKVDAKLNPLLDNKETEVEIGTISISSGGNLAVTKNNGDFKFKSLRAETNSFLASTLPLKDKDVEFVITNGNIQKNDTILLSNDSLDMTGARIHITVNAALQNLQKGDSIILASKAKGDFVPVLVNAGTRVPSGSFSFKVELQNGKLTATIQ